MARKKTRGEKLVEQFEDAVRAHELLGSRDPQEHHEINLSYRLAKSSLITYIQLLESLYHERGNTSISTTPTTTP